MFVVWSGDIKENIAQSSNTLATSKHENKLLS